jgi:hypothetical protein
MHAYMSVQLHACLLVECSFQVRRETRAQSAAAARLAAIEDKLAVLEGAVVGAGGVAGCEK